MESRPQKEYSDPAAETETDTAAEIGGTADVDHHKPNAVFTRNKERWHHGFDKGLPVIELVDVDTPEFIATSRKGCAIVVAPMGVSIPVLARECEEALLFAHEGDP